MVVGALPAPACAADDDYAFRLALIVSRSPPSRCWRRRRLTEAWGAARDLPPPPPPVSKNRHADEGIAARYAELTAPDGGRRVTQSFVPPAQLRFPSFSSLGLLNYCFYPPLPLSSTLVLSFLSGAKSKQAPIKLRRLACSLNDFQHQ